MHHIFQPTFPPPPMHSPLVITLVIVGTILLLGVGVGLCLWVRRRNFYRTNAAGVQEFPNFRSAVFAGFIEWLAMFSGMLAIGAGLIGVLLVITLL